MLLQDLVAAEHPLKIQTPDRKIHSLPGASTLKEAIADAPVRYVLDDAAATLITHTAFAEKNMLDDSLDILRVPSTSFWVEWHDEGRAAIMTELGVTDPMSSSHKRGRAGAFVKADEGGRKGEMQILWDNGEGGADLAPFVIEFDLDDEEFGATAHRTALTRSARLSSADILAALFARTRFRLADAWLEFYRGNAQSAAQFDSVMKENVRMIAAEMPFIAAFCLVLSARGALRYQPSDLARINTARTKKGRQRLLDHITVSLELNSDDEHAGSSPGGSRTSPRLHHVCGHLVRRGASLHWRRPHLRGNPTMGLINSRTIEVRGGTKTASGRLPN